jgi:para-nitrobenzyl esterase
MSDSNEASATLAGVAPIAATAAGQVRGYTEQGIKVFKGVPYGSPTGGAHRWLPPHKPAAWSGVRDTTEFGPMCPQVFGAPLPEETAVLQRGPMSEDCLNLNIWTPAVGAGAGKRPVMVWFHGGGFSVGSGGSSTNDGVNLALKNDVVLVTINHRLNLFGFLHLAELAGSAYGVSGNVGMLDCVAALEWVRDNIAGFGGDPDNVTIFGQSGGGMKVMNLMAMPAAQGLFHRVIAQSGFALSSNPPDQATRIARQVLAKFDLKVAQMAELQALPAERFVALLESRPDLTFALGPVVDGQTLPAGPFTPSAPAVSAGVPLMLGTTETEIVFLPFAPLDPIDDTALHMRLKQYTTLDDADLDQLITAYRSEYPHHDNTYLYQVLASDWLLGADAVTTAERKAALGRAPAHLYYFTKHTVVRDGKLRSPHTLEIPYVFDTLERGAPIVGAATTGDQALADKLSRTWATFARTGDPNNPSMPEWAPYDTQKRTVMVINDECATVADPHAQTRVLIAQLKAKISQSLTSLATGQ